MKIDIYKHQQRYENWKKKAEKKGIQEISKDNSNLVLKYIFDMEKGINVNGSKGSRSFIRLNNLRQRLVFLILQLEKQFKVKDISQVTEEQLFTLFNNMRSGKLKRLDGKIYQSVADYVKVFKAFWNWNIKVNRKNGNKDIVNITLDLDTSREKPKWVYLTEEEIRKFCNKLKYEYKVLIMFIYDSGIRSPGELLNIKVSDLHNNFKELNIREEISKTFGRRIKLMLCSQLLKEYIQEKNLTNNDYLFKICSPVVNRYLQRIAKKCFGDKETLAGEKYSKLTMYDFRHNSCCYWLPRYKSESALKYRFGWKKSDKIHYYSELLGMKDTIQEEDLLIDITKTEVEKRLIKAERDNELLNEKLNNMNNQMLEMKRLMDLIEQKL